MKNLIRNIRVKRLCLRVCVGFCLFIPAFQPNFGAEPNVSLPVNYNFLGLDLILEPTSAGNNSVKPTDEWIHSQLKVIFEDPLQTPEHRYVAASAYVQRTWNLGQNQELISICQKYPPRSDDYLFRAHCIRFGTSDFTKMAELLDGLAQEVFSLYPTSPIPSEVLRYAGDKLSSAGRLHEAIIAYRKIFAVIPADSPSLIIDAKLNLAFAYGSALVSPNLQKQSADYYNEVREWFASRPEEYFSQDRVQWVSYNRAIGQMFLFQNYEEALRDLNQALPHKRLGLDSLVFSAYSLAQLGRKDEAFKILAMVDLDKKTDLKRRAFLTCYVDLTKRILNRSGSINSCLGLESPQTDVLLDLTRTMSSLKLVPADENLMWHKFYQFYAQHLLPDIQRTVESVSNSAEFERTKAEGRYKDLQLRNLGLFQNLSLALSGVAVLLIAGVLMALWLWRNSRRYGQTINTERSRLELVLNNIDEGIVRIKPGLILDPEPSPHLQKLVGGADLRGAPFQVLLDIFLLSAGQKELIRECLNACLGENSIAWDLNYLNLPDEVQIGDVTVLCFWQPICNNATIETVLLVMHDVTAISELKKSSQLIREEADQMLQFAREIMSRHPKAAGQFIKELPQNLEIIQSSLIASNDPNQAMRLAHTMKGTARSLGLVLLHERIHELEDFVRQHDIAQIQVLIGSLLEQIQIYARAISQVIGGSMEADIANIFDIVATLKPGLRDMLGRAKIPLQGIRVYEEVELTSEELKWVQEIVLHALTNAADHGYIIPVKRGQALRSASFDIELLDGREQRILKIRDQGAGIDYESLKTLAARVHWQPAAGQQWTDLLFQDGMSTLRDVSLTSGRGVGLSAIREDIHRLQGQVQLLENDQGPGSLLLLRWPSKISN